MKKSLFAIALLLVLLFAGCAKTDEAPASDAPSNIPGVTLEPSETPTETPTAAPAEHPSKFGFEWDAENYSISVADADGVDISSEVIDLWYAINSMYDESVVDVPEMQETFTYGEPVTLDDSGAPYAKITNYADIAALFLTDAGYKEFVKHTHQNHWIVERDGESYHIGPWGSGRNYKNGFHLSQVNEVTADRIEMLIWIDPEDIINDSPVEFVIAKDSGVWKVESYLFPFVATACPDDCTLHAKSSGEFGYDPKNYNLSVIDADGKDITATVIDLWYAVNHMYYEEPVDIPSMQATFKYGEELNKYRPGVLYCEILNYDEIVEKYLTDAGALQFAEHTDQNHWIMKLDDRLWHIGRWGSGTNYMSSILAADVVEVTDDRIQLSVGYSEENGVIDCVDFVIAKEDGVWKVDHYLFPYVATGCSDRSTCAYHNGYVFDMSLGEHIGKKTYDEMAELLSVEPQSDRSTLLTGVSTNLLVHHDFVEILHFDESGVLSAVEYSFEFEPDADEDKHNLVWNLRERMVDAYGLYPDAAFEDTLLENIGDDMPVGRSVWADPDNSDNVLVLESVAPAEGSGEARRVSVMLTPRENVQ